MPPSKKPAPAESKALLSAVDVIFRVLNPLEPDTRQKILASVYALLGTPGPVTVTTAAAPVRVNLQSPSASGAESSTPSALPFSLSIAKRLRVSRILHEVISRDISL